MKTLLYTCIAVTSLNFALGWNYSDCCLPDMFQLLTLCQLIILRSKLYIFWHVTQMDLFLTCFHHSVILSVCVCHPGAWRGPACILALTHLYGVCQSRERCDSKCDFSAQSEIAHIPLW